MRATFTDPELQQHLESEGYAVLPFLSPDEVAQLRAAYDRLGPAPGDPQRACQSSFHSYDKTYKVAVDEAIRPVLTPHLDSLFDRQRSLPCNFIMKWPGGMGGFGLHQDLALVDERDHRSVEVWIALEDTSAENGQLWMVPRSHRWMPTPDRGIQSFPFAYAETSQRIVKRHAVPVPVTAGTAVVFSHATLHFSLPNRSEAPRLVAITDLIPEEAAHLHYFGDGDGNIGVYEIDETFWTDNNPHTLWKPPDASRRVGTVEYHDRSLSDEDLDRLVAEGLAVESADTPQGAINAGRPWCHRCGTTDMQGDSQDRWIGNVTLLCEDCQAAEATHAATPAHVGM